MGFISSVIRCFCCEVEDEDQPSEQVPILFPTRHDAPGNGTPLSQRPLISSPGLGSCSNRSLDVIFIPRTYLNLFRDSIAIDALHDQNVLEIQESLDYHSDSSCSDSLQKDVLTSSASFLSRKDSNLHGTFQQNIEVSGLQCSLNSDTLVNNSEFVEPKKQDACLLEELYSEEAIEKKQYVYLLKELHCKEPIEKNQDAYLLEDLHFEERVEKKQEICLQKDLHSEEPIENGGKRKESVIKSVVAEEIWVNHYSSFQKILLVGEGDFSFSASLAKTFCSASNMTATSLNSREFLRKNYGRAITNIKDLKDRGCRVVHGVDATQIANNPSLKGVKFDRIIYNFPYAGFFKKESRESQISKHQQLVSLFLKNAKEMIGETGEIHITHKTNGFHHEWKIEALASHEGLRLIEAAHFHSTNYPGYRTKYGFGGDNDFDCNPSKTYKFGLRTTSTKRRKKKKTSDRKI